MDLFLLLYTVSGLALLLIVLGLLEMVENRASTLRERLTPQASTARAEKGKAAMDELGLGELNPMELLRKEINQSGVGVSVKELLNVTGLFCAGFLVAGYVLSHSLVFSAALALLGLFTPHFYIGWVKKKRQEKISQQLETVISLMCSSLGAGGNPVFAIQNVAAEAPEPCRSEFAKVMQEINLGVRTEDALNNLRQRVNSQDLDMMITAILITMQQGGRLSEMLEKIGYTIRERAKLQGDLKSMTAQGRMSANLVGGLPLALLFFMNFLNPSYIRTFFSSTLGEIIFVLALALNGIGYVLCLKSSQVKGL